jgi:hypothetical protein
VDAASSPADTGASLLPMVSGAVAWRSESTPRARTTHGQAAGGPGMVKGTEKEPSAWMLASTVPSAAQSSSLAALLPHSVTRTSAPAGPQPPPVAVTCWPVAAEVGLTEMVGVAADRASLSVSTTPAPMRTSRSALATSGPNSRPGGT